MSTDNSKETTAIPKKWLQKAPSLAESPPPNSDTDSPPSPDEAGEPISHLTKIHPTLNIAEAAELLKCHPDSLRRLAKSGQIPSIKIGRPWIFSQRMLMEWLEKRMQARVTSKGASDGSSALVDELTRQLSDKRRRPS